MKVQNLVMYVILASGISNLYDTSTVALHSTAAYTPTLLGHAILSVILHLLSQIFPNT